MYSALIGVLLLFLTMFSVPLPLHAREEGNDVASSDVYLGDRSDLLTSYSGLDDLIGINTAHSGDVINIGGVTFDRGLGVHCNPPGTETYMEFDISGQDKQYFAAFVGVQSVSQKGDFLEWGSIAFQVWGDGQLLAKTEVLKYQDAPVLLCCEVKDVNTLRLVQDCAGGHSCDWGVWGDARLTDSKPETVEPSEPVFNPDKTSEVTPNEVVGGDYAYVSDMYWVDSKSYSGNSIMRDANTCDEIIFDSDFHIFDKGLGMHGSSDGYTTYVKVNIKDMGFTKFASYYGICDTVTSYDITMASCNFAVFGDGERIFESATPMHYGEAMVYMECDVSGVSELTIAIAGAPAISGAWGCWGGAVLSKSGEVQALFETEKQTETDTDSVTEPATDPATEFESQTEPATDILSTPATDTDTDTETETEDVSSAHVADKTSALPAEITGGETTADGNGCSSAAYGSMSVVGLLALAGIIAAVSRKRKAV